MYYMTEQGLTAEPLIALLVLFGLFAIVMLVLWAVFYVMQAVGIYQLSLTGGLKNPWYGFIPFARDYAVGRLAAVYGKERERCLRILLPVLSVLSALFTVISTMGMASEMIELLIRADAVAAAGGELAPADFVPMFRTLIPFGVLAVVKLLYYIDYFFSLYRIYATFSENGVVYTVCSILFTFLIPIFLFIIRKNVPQQGDAGRYFSDPQFEE